MGKQYLVQGTAIELTPPTTGSVNANCATLIENFMY